MATSKHSYARPRRVGVLSILLLLLLSFSLEVLATAPNLHATDADVPISQLISPEVDGAPALVRRQALSEGSSCAGSEGQWNCMTNSFQRCGSGQWSAVQQCALGTRCTPAGHTYEFHVDFTDGYLGAAPPPKTSTNAGAPKRSGWLAGLGLALGLVWVVAGVVLQWHLH
jgi:hypothetical protein